LVLSKKILDYIHENKFPVYLIPWNHRFADILEFVINNINSSNIQERKFYEQIEKQLIDAYLKNEDFSAAITILENIFKVSFGIYDINFKPKKENSLVATGDILLAQSIEIRNESHLYGYLYTQSENLRDKNAFAFVQRFIIQPLILWFSREEIIQISKQAEKDDFIWSLAKGIEKADEKTNRKAVLLGFDLSIPYICIVGKLYLTNEIKDENSWINFNINSIKEEILYIGKHNKRKVFLTYQQDLLIIYLENKHEDSHVFLNIFLDKIEAQVHKIFPFILFSWGVSEITSKPTDFPQYFNHAKLSVTLCQKDLIFNHRNFYEKTIIFSILSNLSSDEMIYSSAYNIISPVKEYDEKRGTSLLNTLWIYIKAKHISETSRILHLHRQSIIYQLNKVEQLTDLSLKNNNDLFLLEICMRLFFDFSYGELSLGEN